jgi:hypothetical protein
MGNAVEQQIVQSEKSTISKAVYIDPSIHLTKAQLPILTIALRSINNPFYTSILQQIQQTLQRKGCLDAIDLKEITTSLGITNLSFYCGYMGARGETGFAMVWPFTVIALLMIKFHFYIGPIVVGSWFTNWESSDHSWLGVYFLINGREVIHGATSGIALGGIGGFQSLTFEKPEFQFSGLFPLIIVNESPV